MKSRKTLPPKPTDDLPPHSEEIERAALSCVLQAADFKSQQEVDNLLTQLRQNFFYDHRHRTLHHELVQMRMANHTVESVLLHQWLKSHKSPDQLFDRLQECGGLTYIQDKVMNAAPSIFAFPEYL